VGIFGDVGRKFMSLNTQDGIFSEFDCEKGLSNAQNASALAYDINST